MLVVKPDQTHPQPDQLPSTAAVVNVELHLLPTVGLPAKDQICGLDGVDKMDNLQQELDSDIPTESLSNQPDIGAASPIATVISCGYSDPAFHPLSASVTPTQRKGGLSELSINMWFPINREKAHRDSGSTPTSTQTHTHTSPADDVPEAHANAEFVSASKKLTDDLEINTESREILILPNLVSLVKEQDRATENITVATGSYPGGATQSSITGNAIAEVPKPAAVSTENHSDTAVRQAFTGKGTEIPKPADESHSDGNNGAASLLFSIHPTAAAAADPATRLDHGSSRELRPVDSGSGVATTIGHTATDLTTIDGNKSGNVTSNKIATNTSTEAADVTTQVAKNHHVTHNMKAEPVEMNSQLELDTDKDSNLGLEEQSSRAAEPPELATTLTPAIHGPEVGKPSALEQSTEFEQYLAAKQHEQAESQLAFERSSATEELLSVGRDMSVSKVMATIDPEPLVGSDIILNAEHPLDTIVEEPDPESTQVSGKGQAPLEDKRAAWTEIFETVLAFIVSGWLEPIIKWLARLGGRD